MMMFKAFIFIASVLLLPVKCIRPQGYKYRTGPSGEVIGCVPVQCKQNEEPDLCTVPGGRDRCSPCPNGTVNPLMVNTRGLNSYEGKPYCKIPKVFCEEETPPEAHVVNKEECMETGIQVVECQRPKYIGTDIYQCERATITCTQIDEEITLDGTCKRCKKGFSKPRPGPEICVRNPSQSTVPSNNIDTTASTTTWNILDIEKNETNNGTDSERLAVEDDITLTIIAWVVAVVLAVIIIIILKICKVYKRQLNTKALPTEIDQTRRVEETFSLIHTRDISDIYRQEEESSASLSGAPPPPDDREAIADDTSPDQTESVDARAGAAPSRISTRTLEPSDADHSRRSSLSTSQQDLHSLPAFGHTTQFSSASLMNRLDARNDDQTLVAEQPSAPLSGQSGSVPSSGMSRRTPRARSSEDSGIGTGLTPMSTLALSSAPPLSSVPSRQGSVMPQYTAVVPPYTPAVEREQQSLSSAPRLHLSSLMNTETSQQPAAGSLNSGPPSRTHLKVPTDVGVHIEGEESEDEEQDTILNYP